MFNSRPDIYYGYAEITIHFFNSVKEKKNEINPKHLKLLEDNQRNEGMRL